MKPQVYKHRNKDVWVLRFKDHESHWDGWKAAVGFAIGNFKNFIGFEYWLRNGTERDVTEPIPAAGVAKAQ